MTYSISQTPAARHGNPIAAPMQRNSRVPDFVRKDPVQDDNADASAVDAQRSARDQVGRYNRLSHRSGTSATAFAPAAVRIPVNEMPESRALVALRSNCRSLNGAMDGLRYLDPQGKGIPFITHRGESAIVKRDAERQHGAEILVNGKSVFKCFNDDYRPGNTHVLMASPDGVMYAGRHLPPNYLAEANSLVNGAKKVLSGGGNVQRLMNRWGH